MPRVRGIHRAYRPEAVRRHDERCKDYGTPIEAARDHMVV